MKYKQSNALLELYWFYIFTKGNFSNICYLLTSKKKKKKRCGEKMCHFFCYLHAARQ